MVQEGTKEKMLQTDSSAPRSGCKLNAAGQERLGTQSSTFHLRVSFAAYVIGYCALQRAESYSELATMLVYWYAGETRRLSQGLVEIWGFCRWVLYKWARLQGVVTETHRRQGMTAEARTRGLRCPLLSLHTLGDRGALLFTLKSLLL